MSDDKPAFTVRPVVTSDEFAAIPRLQRLTWNTGADGTTLHTPMLVALQRYGGIVLGAFAGTDLIGFAVGFIGKTAPGGRYFHYSQIAAAHPDWQSRGVGLALKRAQRAHALVQGYDLMRWSFDPLLTRNAHFNFNKLGAVGRTYVPDMYGTGTGGLYGHVATDRLIVDWELSSPVVAERLAPHRQRTGAAQSSTVSAAATTAPQRPEVAPLPLALSAAVEASGTITPGTPNLALDAPRVGIAVPAHHATAQSGATTEWRQATRAAFIHYLANGYAIRAINVQREDPIAMYVLEQEA